MAATGGNDTVTNKQLYDELLGLRAWLEGKVDPLEKRVAALERWRAYLAGGVAVAVAVAGFAATHFH